VSLGHKKKIEAILRAERKLGLLDMKGNTEV